MRIGISTAQWGQLARPRAVAAMATAAEQLGYASLWATDRPAPVEASGTRGLDPLAVLCATAAVTTRVRLGVALLADVPRDTEALTRALASLDALSEGRMSLCLGLEQPERHLARVEALLTALDGVAPWASGEPAPPVFLALSSRRGIELAARRGGGWSPAGLPVGTLARTWKGIRNLAARLGRDPDVLQLVVRTEIVLTDRPVDGRRGSFCGTAEQVADDVEATRRIGADEVVLGLAGDPCLDEALDGYARIAEAAALRATAAAVSTTG
jgi:alkanesulfonate monooxygenase SsuD/methylene tetrahydromethanopterin reductase-like flavin-dependent oxidoreductase (luciferase family)